MFIPLSAQILCPHRLKGKYTHFLFKHQTIDLITVDTEMENLAWSCDPNLSLGCSTLGESPINLPRTLIKVDEKCRK